MVLIERTDFVSLPSEDIERAAEFYGTTLGLECSALNLERGYAEFETGSLTIQLFDRRSLGRENRSGGSAVALHVADVAAARAELEAAGVEFAIETVDTGVCHLVPFADPDGNELMLHHRYAPLPPRP